jgi:hypothetical protein
VAVAAVAVVTQPVEATTMAWYFLLTEFLLALNEGLPLGANGCSFLLSFNAGTVGILQFPP